MQIKRTKSLKYKLKNNLYDCKQYFIFHGRQIPMPIFVVFSQSEYPCVVGLVCLARWIIATHIDTTCCNIQVRHSCRAAVKYSNCKHKQLTNFQITSFGCSIKPSPDYSLSRAHMQIYIFVWLLIANSEECDEKSHPHIFTLSFSVKICDTV